jgi:nitroimidazol reductase NimA-like FMN-containing flavoprotein (pyridoxamine 5'-phosphate oxidase superfamily)/osmotically-inducible protein OsmY
MATNTSAPSQDVPTDVDLVHAVTRALVTSADVDHTAVRVTADSGRVRLTGRVATHAQRLVAANLTAAVPGVTRVDNALTVGDIDLDVVSRPDAEIEEAVERAIALSKVAVSDLRFSVLSRVVKIEGRVRTARDRAALRHVIQDVPGVHFVENHVAFDEATPDHAEELAPTECLRLLGTEHVGRLAVQEATGVDIFPVNYLVHDGKVYFRSAPGAKMIRLTQAPDVAFEADGHDGDWTWSVVVKGTARRLDDDAEIVATGIDDVPTALPGEKLNYVRITPRQVSGRRFRHAD